MVSAPRGWGGERCPKSRQSKGGCVKFTVPDADRGSKIPKFCRHNLSMAPEQKTRKSARYGWVEGKGSVSIENRFHWKLDGYIDRYAQVSLVAVCHKVHQHNMKIIGIIFGRSVDQLNFGIYGHLLVVTHSFTRP